MSTYCHLNGESHDWHLVDPTRRQYWCRDCGAFGHKRADNGEMEWEAPKVHRGHRKPTGGFLDGLKKRDRFDREDPVGE